MLSPRMSVRNTLPAALLLAVFALPAAAHKHHSSLTEDQKNADVDALLVIHIMLQTLIWGILFPTGMVLGMSKSRWHVPLQVRRSYVFRARPNALKCDRNIEYRYSPYARWILARTCARRTGFPGGSTRHNGQHPIGPDHSPACSGHLSQTTHPRRDHPSVGCTSAWSRRESVPNIWLDANVVWCYLLQRVLPRR